MVARVLLQIIQSAAFRDLEVRGEKCGCHVSVPGSESPMKGLKRGHHRRGVTDLTNRPLERRLTRASLASDGHRRDEESDKTDDGDR
jgi:hypothetical protein